jgi:HEAT repeat protein
MLRYVGFLWTRPPKVEKLKRKGDAAGLVRALEYEDVITDRDGQVVDLGEEVRVEAAAALAELDGPVAREGLLCALADPEQSVRIVALEALRRRRDRETGDALVAAAACWTQPELEQAREEAVGVLAGWRVAGAARRMAEALLTRSSDLGELSFADGVALRRLVDACGAMEATVSDLVAALSDGDKAERARTMLVWLAPDSVDALIAAVRSRHAPRDAAIALGAIGDARAVDALSELLLSGGDVPPRVAAARALGQLAHPAAVRPLLEASADPEHAVRTEAAASFDRLGNLGIALATSVVTESVQHNGNGTHSNGAALPPPLTPRPAPMLRRLLRRAPDA